MITTRIPKLLLKKKNLTIYKDEQKEHKFWRQKNKKSGFYKKKSIPDRLHM